MLDTLPSRRWMAFLTTALFIAVGLPAAEAISSPGTNCSGTGCEIGKPAPVDLKVRVCDGPSQVFVTYDNTLLDQGSATGCTTASFWVLGSGNQVYGPGALRSAPNEYHKYRDPDGDYMIQYFKLRQQGEEVDLQVNYTLVNNGTLIHYKMHNHGASAWEVGFKYSYDIHLGSNSDPAVCVPGRDKATSATGPLTGKLRASADGTTDCYAYHGTEIEFGPVAHDINFVKVWNTENGPDGDDDLKAYLWWHPGWGGTPPDFLQYGDSGRMIGVSNNLYYTLTTPPISESELQPYYGYPSFIQLAPDDGKPGGDDEWEAFLWFGTGIPDPLITYGINGQFTNRGEDVTGTTRFVEAGHTTTYPIQITSTTGVGSGATGNIDQRVQYLVDAQELGDGWSYELVDATTGQPIAEDVLSTGQKRLLNLHVSAPENAHGNDAARINVRAILPDRPEGAFNQKSSSFDMTLQTTTIVRPDHGIQIRGPNDTPSVRPGESIEFDLEVKNVGNLKLPYGVIMDVPAGLGFGWESTLTPQTFELGRHETQNVRLRLAIPEGAFGGEQLVEVRSQVAGQNEFNQTQVKFRILSDAEVAITTEVQELALLPGQTGRFDATVTNLGYDEVDLDFRGVADEVEGFTGTWVVNVDTSKLVGPLAPGVAEVVHVEIVAPEGADAGEQVNVKLQVTKKGHTQVLDDELVRAVVSRLSSLELVPLQDNMAGDPGRTLDYNFLVRNVGNAREDLSMELHKLPAGWTSSMDPDEFVLEPRMERQVNLKVTSTPRAQAGTETIEVVARNADQMQSDPVPLVARINQVFDASISTQTPVLRMLPTDDINVRFEITNLGNGPDQFYVDGIPSTWDVRLEPEMTPMMEPGEKFLVDLKGTATGQVGQFHAMLEAVSTVQGSSVLDEPYPLSLIVSRPDLFVKNAYVESAGAHVGDLETIVAEIQNLGGIEAKKVQVMLLVNGKPTGEMVEFDRLAPGRTGVASLSWAKAAGPVDYEVVVDPHNLHDEGEFEGNNVFVFNSGPMEPKKLGLLGDDGRVAEKVPATGPVFVLVLLGAALMLVRRRR